VRQKLCDSAIYRTQFAKGAFEGDALGDLWY
jgi:hypothetical protein